MEIILETERCFLREFIVDDATEIFALNNDPEVIRYTGDPSFESVDTASKFLSGYKDYIVNKMGRWSVIRKSDHQFLGWCGLKFLPEDKTIDLGYRFHHRFWNQGYATETGLACVKYGFEKLHLDRIIGRADKNNIGSIRVLQKCRMCYVKDYIYDDRLTVLYEILSSQHP